MRPTTVVSVGLPVLTWWLGLTVFSVGLLYATGGGAETLFTTWGFVGAFCNRAALVLPFAAFAGGLAGASSGSPREDGVRSVATLGLVAATLVYVLGAWVEPIAQYRSHLRGPDSAAVRFSQGPRTPVVVLEEYRRVRANPPAAFIFSTDAPDLVPPNWTLYLLHLDVAAAVFALVSTFLGLLVGGMTSGLSPPRRRRVRWSAGLLNAVGYLAVAIPASRWVRQSPTNSAVIAAWSPVLVGATVVLVLFMFARRGTSRPDASSA